jgi:hypothetical protein
MLMDNVQARRRQWSAAKLPSECIALLYIHLNCADIYGSVGNPSSLRNSLCLRTAVLMSFSMLTRSAWVPFSTISSSATAVLI